MWYLGYYKIASETSRQQAMFTVTIPNEKTFEEGMKYKRKQGLEAASAKQIPVKVHQIFYIPLQSEDFLTLETLDDRSQPILYTENTGCPFEVNLIDYDQTEYVRARIVADIDWEFPKTENSDKTFDKIEEITHVEAIILDLHGGAFMFGSSLKQLKYSEYYATTTKYPVVTLDYRLAPDHKFPSSINDCWQAYLWLIKYSEKYLKLRFDKI